jgi:F0F1-type ATP synthase membrane subunit b/b'
MAEVIQLWSPLIQGGFAVFALLLLGINVWLVKQLLKVLKDNSQVIAGNTRAIESVATIASDTKGLMQELRDELWKRPCLLDGREYEEHQ